MAEISIEAAVEQLHQMFGDYDKATLAAVLEANGGHVERTVEHLLGNPAGVSGGGGGGGGGGATPGTDHDAALALQLSREWSEDPTNEPPPPVIPRGIPTPYGPGGAGRGGGGGMFSSDGSGQAVAASTAAAGAASESGRRGRRVALPEEFLRTPGWNGGGGGASSDPQVAADARLAMMLQNQSFQRELQAHPELAYLGRRSSGASAERASGPGIKEQLTVMGNDVRRKLDELAVRWKMKDPGRADETTEYSRVPLMNSRGDDADDQAEVVNFSQNTATRRSHPVASSGGGSTFRSDSAGEEQLADPRRSKKDR